MEYQALYRKYRPQRFDQVIGQDHVTATLSKEIVEGRVAHAYLFTGPRGTGKTTTARLLAKSLNCPERGAEGSEPCGDCHSCVAVAGSSSMDVVELDAASHNKVEDIRDLRASVSTVASIGGARRVFILDEAHMLTKAASNALLKTLEEPPDRVHFVLATTEPYRLLDTIRSRSQRFDFHPVPAAVIAAHLGRVCEWEGYQASPEALQAVAGRAGGSVRDALSLLEQVAALDGRVSRAGVRKALGVAGPDDSAALADAIAGEDARAALELVADLAARGVDLRRFAGDALGFFRGVFLTMYARDGVERLTGEPPEMVARWTAPAGRLLPATVMRAIDLLGEALVKLREGREERMMLELAVLKMVRPELDDGAPALLRRVERLERGGSGAQGAAPSAAATREARPAAPSPSEPARPASGARSRSAPDAAPPVAGASQPETSDPAGPEADPAGVPAAAGTGGNLVSTPSELERIWPQLVAGVREKMGFRREAMFREAIPSGIEDSTVVFDIPAGMDFHLRNLSSDGELNSHLAEHASDLLGQRLSVSFRFAGSGPVTEKEEHDPPAPPPASAPPASAPPSGGDPPGGDDGLQDVPLSPTGLLALLQEQFGATEVEEG